MKPFYLKHFSTALILFSIIGCSKKSTEMEVSSLYIRALPTGKLITAAFGELTNHRSSICHLVGAQSPMAKSIEIHQHSHEGGMMRMRQIKSLAIAPEQTLTLKPGGYHLMVFDASPLLNSANNIEIIFKFSDCPALTSRAKVKTLFKE